MRERAFGVFECEPETFYDKLISRTKQIEFNRLPTFITRAMLCADQFETSTSPPGHLTVHRALGGGNLNIALEGWGI